MIRQLLIVVGCGLETRHAAQDANEEDAVNMAYAIELSFVPRVAFIWNAVNRKRLPSFSTGFFELFSHGCKGQAIKHSLFFNLKKALLYRIAFSKIERGWNEDMKQARFKPVFPWALMFPPCRSADVSFFSLG